MRTGASGIASKIFQRRLGYHRSCSRYQYVIWGLQHRLSSPRILLQGGSGIAGVVTGTNVGLRLSSPTTINTLGLEGRCCRTTPLWGNSLSVFLPTHLNADSFGTEDSSGVHVSPKIVGPLWRSLVPTICGYYGPCDTKKCVGAYARPRLAYDILWVAVPTTLCCGWRTLCQLCLVGGGPCTLFSILYTGYSECIPMASMCHLNCVGPYGVLVSCTLCV